MLNHFVLLQRLVSPDTNGVSLSSLVYFYFPVPGDRIPQISPPFPCWNETFRAQDLERSHAQKEWSTNAEVGHVSKHFRFLETTTSKAHSPHDGEIKARWRSGLSFKYVWVYEGGGRWEAEFWNELAKGQASHVPRLTANRCVPRTGPAVAKTVTSWSQPCHGISTTSLAQFILFQSNQTY